MTDMDLTAIIEAFRVEVRELTQALGEEVLQLEKVADAEAQKQTTDTAFRHAHSIKGAAASLGFRRIKLLIHSLEDMLSAIRDEKIAVSPELVDLVFQTLDRVDQLAQTSDPDAGEPQLDDVDHEIIDRLQRASGQATDSPVSDKPAPTDAAIGAAVVPTVLAKSPARAAQTSAFVRISRRKLDTLLSRLGELVEMKIKMEEMLRTVREVDEELERLERPDQVLPRQPLQQLSRGIEQETQYLDRVLGGLQDELNELRMVPIDSLFPQLRRGVRDVCRKRKIGVTLSLEGGQYQLDRRIVEELKAPLLHLLRNAVDHGIERPAERLDAGKPADGSVSLRVEHRGSSVRLEISDDGRGIDQERLRQRAAERGVATAGAAELLGEAELTRLIFQPGLSTSATTDEISGRGVGLDVVKRAVEAQRGTVSVESTAGQGTRFFVTLPLTLATDIGLFVRVGTERFVVPRNAVQRVVVFNDEDIVSADGHTALYRDGSHYPLVQLQPTLQVTPHRKTGRPTLALILRVAEASAAIGVDEVESESEIVIRNLGSFVHSVPAISGSTVTASGELFFVLNPVDLVREASLSSGGDGGRPSPGPLRDDRAILRRRILVADDSVTTRMINEKMLVGAGFDVVSAPNGSRALELLRSRPFDLVLSDVQMPGLDGYELARRVKGDPDLTDIPVILMTALDRREDRAKGLAAGAEAYLVKNTVTQGELLETIEQLI